MESIVNSINPLDTTDFTLIIPSVSVGNVGQLTIDLLISSLDFKRYATIWDPAIIASVGGDPFTGNSEDVGTACELFINQGLKIIVLQLRSSIEFRLALEFFHKLKQVIRNLKCKEVFILTSTFAHELHDIGSSHFRYITNDSNMEELLKGADVLPLEASLNGRHVIYGAGFAVKLYEILSESIKCSVIIKYSSEGDNRSDALQMLNVLYSILSNLKNVSKNIKFPCSWQFVFGNPPPLGIY